MSDLMEIQSRLAKLQKQESEIKTRELDKAEQKILPRMNAFGIASKDLQPRKSLCAKAKDKAKAAAAKSAVSPGNQTFSQKSGSPCLDSYSKRAFVEAFK